MLAALDVHPRVAMQILRHSKSAITMEIYTEVPSAATRAAPRLAEHHSDGLTASPVEDQARPQKVLQVCGHLRPVHWPASVGALTRSSITCQTSLSSWFSFQIP